MQKIATCSLRARRLRLARAVALGSPLTLTAGCGGGDDSGNDAGNSATFGMSWHDDETVDKSVGAKATFDSSGGADSYDISGVGEHGTVTVEVNAATPIAPQTFSCNKTAAGEKVRVSYYPTEGGIELTDQSCTVVLTKSGGVGDTLVGTFEAVLALRDGGTKAISNGKFNLHVSAL